MIEYDFKWHDILLGLYTVAVLVREALSFGQADCCINPDTHSANVYVSVRCIRAVVML